MVWVFYDMYPAANLFVRCKIVEITQVIGDWSIAEREGSAHGTC